MGIMSYFKDMWPNIQIRRNFIIYACFWSLFTMVYSVILIELGSVGGNLYVNMFLCSTLEIIAAIMAGALTANYNCTTVLKYLLTFLAIFLTVFLAAPPSLSSASPIEILIFIVCMFLAKFNNDILNLVTYLYLPKAFTDKYVGFWMLCSRFLSRFLGLFIPMISFMMRSVGLHPFCFYGICWIICRLFFNMTEEVQYEGVDDLLNDMQVNLRERLSVMSGSFSNGIVLHDDNLKNIHVDGMALSLIRRYKQEPGSFIGTEMVRIRDTIMRNSKVSLKKNIGMDVEMKEKE